jgi:hypothetical protein
LNILNMDRIGGGGAECFFAVTHGQGMSRVLLNF